MMRSPPVRGVGGGCRRVGLERRVLLAASSHLKMPARGTTQTRGERGGGRRDGGNGGPTRWGERGAAVGRCAGRWTGVRGLGCCGAGRTSHGGRQTPSRKRRACQKARKTGVGVWVSMNEGRGGRLGVRVGWCAARCGSRAGREAVAAHPSHHPSRGVLGGRRRALAAAGGRRDGGGPCGGPGRTRARAGSHADVQNYPTRGKKAPVGARRRR